MTITRIWHGYTTPERADDYEALLKAEVIKGIEGKNIPGFRQINVLRRASGHEVEFVTIMEFDSLDSVKAFVGEDYEEAYVPAEARAILSRFDERSQHYELRDSRSYRMEQVGDRVISVADKDSGFRLSDDAWFVRQDSGRGSAPVRREGHRVVMRFVWSMIGWLVLAVVLALAGVYGGPAWLTTAAPLVFAAGALLTAWILLSTVKKHTDYSISYSEYLKARKNA